MKIEEIGLKLQNNESVYIKDDFEQMAIRIMPDDGETKVYAKFKGKKEYAIDRKIKLVYDIEVNGEEITEADYKNY